MYAPSTIEFHVVGDGAWGSVPPPRHREVYASGCHAGVCCTLDCSIWALLWHHLGSQRSNLGTQCEENTNYRALRYPHQNSCLIFVSALFDVFHIWIFGHAETVPRYISRFHCLTCCEVLVF